MKSLLEQFKMNPRRGPSDLLGVDLASSGTKIVRLRRNKDKVTVVGAAILPPVSLKAPESGANNDALLSGVIPKNLLANYACLAVTGESTVVRLLSLPGHTEQTQLVESQVREHIGVEGEYRVGFVVTTPPKGKSETKLLVAAMPEADAKLLLNLVRIGAPAPFSIEVAGLAVLNAFLHGPGAQMEQESIGLLDAGARVSFLALFSKGNLALVRKFDFGGDALTAKVQQQLGVSREIAQGIISDGSFDISQSVHDVMDPFLRQLSISRDFVERREDCRLSKLYLSGGMSLSKYWLEELRNTTGIEAQTWDPFEGLTLAPAAIPDEFKNQRARFTAAVGAALGAFSAS
jgi:Tfp pilus assembly PilM family ATPase